MTIPDRGRGDNTYPDAYISASEHRFSPRRIPRDILLVVLILLVAGFCFGLGVYVGKQGSGAGKDDGLWIENLVSTASSSSQSASVVEAKPPQVQPAPKVTNAPIKPAVVVPALSSGGEVVASKTGSKYYLPWCGTVSRIKEENKVWFATRADAEKAGYAPAQNCKGL